MTVLREFSRRLWGTLRRNPTDDDLKRELSFHLEQAEEELRGNGYSPAEAARIARVRVGGLSQAMESLRDQRGLPWLDDLRADVRGVTRSFRRNPVHATTVTAMLAVGIAANVAVFAVVDAFLLRPLPFHEPDRLVHVSRMDPSSVGFDMRRVSVPDFRDFRRENQTFSDLGAYVYDYANVGERGSGGRLGVGAVTVGLFELLGVPLAAGRTFIAEEQLAGADRVAVLSERLAIERFGGVRNAVGQSIVVDSRPYEVIGVMPGRFKFPLPDTAFWVPLRLDDPEGTRDLSHAEVIGRLRPRVALTDAQHELRNIAANLEAVYPDRRRGLGVRVVPLRQGLLFYYPALRLVMAFLGGVAVLFLIIVCANVANLMLVNGLSRAYEMAIRRALGATRARLVRQLLVETAVLASLAAIAGTILAAGASRLVDRGFPPALYRVDAIEVNPRALLFMMGVTIAIVVLVGVRQALQSTGLTLGMGMRERHAALAAAGRGSRIERLLVIAQVAVSVVMTTVAMAFVSIVTEFRQAPTGLNPTGVLTARLAFRPDDRADDSQVARFYEQFLDETRRLAGVRSAALVNPLPLSNESRTMELTIEGRPADPDERMTAVMLRVTPEYFATMGIPIVSGRALGTTDREGATPVAVISQGMAQSFWGARDPVGQRISDCTLCTTDQEEPGLGTLTIVGVVGDAKHATVWQDPQPQLYLSLEQAPSRGVSVVVRSANVAPTTLAGPLRDTLRRLNPDLVLGSIRTMDQVLDEALQPIPIVAAAQALMAVGALVLAAVGLTALLRRLVSLRLREFGVRLSLGARPLDIYRQVIGRGLRPTAVGAVIGGALATALVMALQSGGQATVGVAGPPPSFAESIGVPMQALAVLMAVALMACYFPARRAARVDPAELLRSE